MARGLFLFLEMMRAVVCEPGAVPGMMAAIQAYGDQG
jgi:hypothetical protein